MDATSKAKARSAAATKKMVGGMKDLWQLAKKDFTDNSKELKQDLVDLLDVAKVRRANARDAKLSTLLASRAVNPDAGGELLTRYKEEWSLVHRRTEETSRATAALDAELQSLHGTVSQSHVIITASWKEFKCLPDVVKALETTREKVEELGKLLGEVEKNIVECSRTQAELDTARKKGSLKVQQVKKTATMERELQHLQETLEREKKRKGEMEQAREGVKVRERQKAFQEIFQKQMAEYRETGSIERAIGAEDRERSSSILEEVVIEDQEGAASLDQFLHDIDIAVGKEEEESGGAYEPGGEGEQESEVQSKSP